MKAKKKYIPEHIKICQMIIKYKKAYLRWQENKLRNELFQYAEKKLSEYELKQQPDSDKAINTETPKKV